MATKICARCRCEKPTSDFARKATRRDGLAGWCRACFAENYQQNKARYDAKNKSAYAARMGTQKGRREHNERSRRWRAENPQVLRDAVADWKRRNPEQRNAHERTRRARAAGAVGAHTAADIARLIAKQKGRCAYCETVLDAYHIDHKTPLARGGMNDANNLAVTCPPCNLRKGTMTAPEFMERRKIG